jgi:hypothetical protein
MKRRVDVYLGEHDNNLQHLKAEDGIHFFMSGGGGAGPYELGLVSSPLLKVARTALPS